MIKKILNSIIVIMIILGLLITGCQYEPCCYDPAKDQEIRFPRDIASYSDLRIYTFDPKTILAELDRSDGEIFQPIPGLVQEQVFPAGSFAWQQQDYLKITIALNQAANQDSLDGWSLYGLNLFRDCTDNPVGFDYSFITYFKSDGEQYTVREIDIQPLDKEAIWGGNTHFPRPSPIGWQKLDLKNLKISADDALQIAESHGGKAARQTVNNDCRISVGLGDNWIVKYDRSNAPYLFQMSIDPYFSGH